MMIPSTGVTHVLCDGVNKLSEFHLFSHFLKAGDVIAVHDTKFDNVRETVLKNDLYSLFERDGWLAFRKGKV